jgi:hypothetical protein
MKTIKQVTIKPVFVDQLPTFRKQNEVYISKERKISEHVCLCGCGGTVVMPLNYELFPNTNWKLVEENNGTVSFIGSVGNYQFACKSHYIITKNVANFV